MTIAFIGIGNMGLPIATNLIAAHHKLHVYNRTALKAKALADLGATIFTSAEEAVAQADILITMLTDDAAVTNISEKVVAHMKPSTVHVSMSTIAPATAKKLLQLHEQHKVVMFLHLCWADLQQRRQSYFTYYFREMKLHNKKQNLH